MSNIAPEGKKWYCFACGKTTKDKYGNENGWDESCMLNCTEIDEASFQPSDEQFDEYVNQRNMFLETLCKKIEESS